MMMTLTIFDVGETVGEYVSGSMDDEEIVLMVDGSEEIFDTFDIDGEPVKAVGSGKSYSSSLLCQITSQIH